uniref:PHD-type domain-containing protein n=1 Tax=Ditylenchus dipsaci TaxID=166011 RepID=A0A915CTA9_9BILA
MTIYGRSQSFQPLHSSRSHSVDSLCSSNDSWHNTNTTGSSLSLISLPSEDEYWQEFGYLLDCKQIDAPVENKVPINHMSKNGSESDFSSMNVEVASSFTSHNTNTHSCCDKCSEGEFSRDVDLEEPVAKRTRRARTESLKEGLDKLSEMPKEDVIYNFLCSSNGETCKPSSANVDKPVEKCVKWHNVCRPWWLNPLFNGHDSENEKPKAIRKLRDSEDAMCDPRLISLGGNTTETKDVSFKMESIATNDEPTAYIPATTNATHLDEEKEIQENLSILESPKQAADNKRNKRNLQSSSTDKTDSEDQEGGKKSGSKRVHSVDSQKKEVSSKVQPSSHKPTSKRQNRLNQLQQQDNDADDENEASGRSVVDGSSKYCICGSISGPADSKKFYISCSKCKSYFHGKCVGLTEKKAQKLSGSWTCADCEKQKSSTEELYCVCRQPYNDKRFYVGCDSCEDWFHPECINTTQQEISQFEEFICPKCRE